MLEKMLAETAYLLDRRLVIALGVEQHIEIVADNMRLAVAGGEMAVGRARLTGSVMRTTTLHLLVAASTLPTSIQITHLLQRAENHLENDTKCVLVQPKNTTSRAQASPIG